MHFALPFPTVKKPAGQLSHFDWPGAAMNFPGVHSKHSVALALGVYLPTPHVSQALAPELGKDR
jgi:hypothetical protein